jgi:hypothetical protein
MKRILSVCIPWAGVKSIAEKGQYYLTSEISHERMLFFLKAKKEWGNYAVFLADILLGISSFIVASGYHSLCFPFVLRRSL